MLLPDADDPLVLADGTRIGPDGRVVKDRTTNFVAVPSPSEAQKIVTNTRKSIAELPLPPKQLGGVALVGFYTLFGLSDRDIAIACDNALTIEQIENIRELDAYKDFIQAAKDNLMNTQVANVREIFQTHAKTAAQKIIELADGENDVLSFKASQDILDRAGHRPADIVEHRHTMEDSLNIVITRRDETVQVPVIDIQPTRIDEDANVQ